MAILEQIEADLKRALLAGDRQLSDTLRLLKSVLQYEAVDRGVQGEGLTDEQAQQALAKEQKKRVDTAQIYKKAGETERAAKEEAEAKIIEKYLPAKLSEAEIKQAVEAEAAKLESPTPSDMGKIIGTVKAKLGPGADGAVIARITKELLE